MNKSNQAENDLQNDTTSVDDAAKQHVEENTATDGDAATDTAQIVDVETLQQQYEAAKTKADENWDQYLRLQAEMDNLRKRSTKQVEDAHKFASQKIVEALLPVIDSLEMGMQAEGDLDSIREGMNLTMQQFESVMEKFSIAVVNPLGEVFNPDLHQAMSMQPCENQENNTISMVMQKGYTLSGRLIRPAMVMVCKNS
jgi:molecular chaperone GrpE